MIINPAPGNTPLDLDEMEGLIPSYVTTQSELNQVEQQNILQAAQWVIGHKANGLLTDSFLRELHRRMLGDVWKWAGKYRITGKNIGVPASDIPGEIKKLCDDTGYWIENKTFPWNEIGARFHHRLVAIHPYPNGNGRHARLATDVLLRAHDQEAFAWGARTAQDPLDRDGENRRAYLNALKAADQGDFGLLLKFVRS